MKEVTFHIENQVISYKANWSGIETVSVNGNQISKKLSLPNRKHQFVLNVYGKTENFYITSKQAFNTGHITVQLFHNDVLIDEALIEFDFGVLNQTKNTSDNGMLTTGLLFVVLGLVFDWSKVFLFIGLLFLFCSFSENSNKKKTSEDSSATDDHN
jgi:hypothetical protein|nr:hypothetical protein [uncultured Psychroserpens sp.]